MIAGSIIHPRALQQHQRDMRCAVHYLVTISGSCLFNGPIIEAKHSIQQVVPDQKITIRNGSAFRWAWQCDCKPHLLHREN